MRHIRITINGIVQGVGFRPFVYREALNLNLNGWVKNSNEGIIISVQGKEEDIFKLIDKILFEGPKLSKIEFFKTIELDLEEFKEFEILESDNCTNNMTLISQDIATCKKCEEEIIDSKKKRRYLFPFNNCTNCGPRYTIIKSLPYDRKNTTMAPFKMCVNCQNEYKDPINRRFHAEPICCNDCGPKLDLLSNIGEKICDNDEAINHTRELVKEGALIAVKGIGGFNIICDAKNCNSVNKVRQLKQRPHKPLAIMIKNITVVKKYFYVSEEEERELIGSKKPIVLLKKRDYTSFKNVSNNSNVGVVLPFSPIHYMLFDEEIDMIVFTSGNSKGVPINYKNNESCKNLRGIVDYFLLHNRDIETPIDDSVVKVYGNNVNVIRPGRGYAPYSFKHQMSTNILAIGSELKNTFSLCSKNHVVISPYNGDIVYKENIDYYKMILNKFTNIYKINFDYIVDEEKPVGFLKDIFPIHDKVIKVFHHHAHIASCIAENNIKGPVIGIAFDGNGYGEDGNIWGGEFLTVTLREFKRMAHFEYFNLIGGDVATLNPWRIAYDLCTTYIEDTNKYIKSFDKIDESEIKIVNNMKKYNLNCFKTCSIGRLFDGIAYLLGFTGEVSYEGQAAIYLESLSENINENEYYNVTTEENDEIIIGLHSLINDIILDINRKIDKHIIAKKFHNTIIEISSIIVDEISEETRIKKVCMSGGVFQNEILKIGLVNSLKEKGYEVYTNNLIPTNDSGISFGQLFIANEIIDS